MMTAGIIILCIVLLGLVLYWLLILAEGTHLGPRTVEILYDWTAKRYDRIKNLHCVDEARFVGLPLSRYLAHVQLPRVLDVATGTARVPLALMRSAPFEDSLVGLDRSHYMLAIAQEATRDYQEHLLFVRGDATALSFSNRSFDCVTCLEALEFMRGPDIVLQEMIRVLKPGGILMISNRVGRDAVFFPGRLRGRGHLENTLHEMGLTDIRNQRWQVHYDLIWAHKPADDTLSAHTTVTDNIRMQER